jgi:hypothetical protein
MMLWQAEQDLKLGKMLETELDQYYKPFVIQVAMKCSFHCMTSLFLKGKRIEKYRSFSSLRSFGMSDSSKCFHVFQISILAGLVAPASYTG